LEGISNAPGGECAIVCCALFRREAPVVACVLCCCDFACRQTQHYACCWAMTRALALMPNVRAVIRARTLTPPHNGKQAESRCSAARAYALRALALCARQHLHVDVGALGRGGGRGGPPGRGRPRAPAASSTRLPSSWRPSVRATSASRTASDCVQVISLAHACGAWAGAAQAPCIEAWGRAVCGLAVS